MDRRAPGGAPGDGVRDSGCPARGSGAAAHLRGGAAARRTRGSSGRPPRPAAGGSGPVQGPVRGGGGRRGLAHAPSGLRGGGPRAPRSGVQGSAPAGCGRGCRGAVGGVARPAQALSREAAPVSRAQRPAAEPWPVGKTSSARAAVLSGGRRSPRPASSTASSSHRRRPPALQSAQGLRRPAPSATIPQSPPRRGTQETPPSRGRRGARGGSARARAARPLPTPPT